MFLRFSPIFLVVLFTTQMVSGQFWRELTRPSDKDEFIAESRSLRPSGICYKELPAKAADPELRIQMVSYCCPGYRRVSNPRAMECEPICSGDCTNGVCTAPDECECAPGYTRRDGRCEDW